MAESKLCPYLLQGKCDTPNCPFIHGLLCETCGLHCLIPDFPEQNEKHRKGLYWLCSTRVRVSAKRKFRNISRPHTATRLVFLVQFMVSQNPSLHKVGKNLHGRVL